MGTLVLFGLSNSSSGRVGNERYERPPIWLHESLLNLVPLHTIRWAVFIAALITAFVVAGIRRSVWRTHLNEETKTHEDEDEPGVVPIIESLRGILDAIKPEIASGWMFPNTIGGALDLDNLADRVIKPVLKANGLKWKGWHAYRRGLATNLHELGVPDKVIQAILRHEDVKTTQRSYIKTGPES